MLGIDAVSETELLPRKTSFKVKIFHNIVSIFKSQMFGIDAVSETELLPCKNIFLIFDTKILKNVPNI